MDVICVTCRANEFKDSGKFPDVTRGNVKIVDCHGACKLYGSAPPPLTTYWACICEGCDDRFITIKYFVPDPVNYRYIHPSLN
jgi:hypothetical protein